MSATYGSLFSGYGGLDLAVEAVFGASPVWHCENDAAASKILEAHWPGTPNLGDITAVDWSTVQRPDILCGGFPCQDISSAGRGAGILEGNRSGLWFRYADAIRVLRPRLVIVENVRALLVRGIDIVLGSLAELGFDAEWCVLPASAVGACHRRERVFLSAWPANADGPLGGFPWSAGEAVPEPGAIERPRRHGCGPDHGSAADADGDGFGRVTGPHARRGAVHANVGGPVTAYSSSSAADWRARRPAGNGSTRSVVGDLRIVVEEQVVPGTTWGPYAGVITRWANVIGRPAPAPTDDRGRLNPLFVEWMMGLPAGWVTEVDGLTRSQQLARLGNGVVPLQADVAVRGLLARCERLAAVS